MHLVRACLPNKQQTRPSWSIMLFRWIISLWVRCLGDWDALLQDCFGYTLLLSYLSFSRISQHVYKYLCLCQYGCKGPSEIFLQCSRIFFVCLFPCFSVCVCLFINTYLLIQFALILQRQSHKKGKRQIWKIEENAQHSAILGARVTPYPARYITVHASVRRNKWMKIGWANEAWSEKRSWN